MNKIKKITLTFSFTMIALGFIAVPGAIPIVSAQEAADDDALILEEIVVTSRKREERLLDAPLTITVLTAQDIEIKGIDNFADIVDFSPGFFWGGPSGGNNDRSSRRLIIRGMQPSTDRQTRQSASVYIDGAPVLGAEIGDTAGAERIEVIKGPQSAYFGRSSFGGAINIITKTPGHEWKGKISAEAGQWNTSDFGIEIEGPLIQDKLSMRLSANQDSYGGSWRNASNRSEMLGSRETTDFTLTLYATPTERFSAKLRLHAWEDDDGDTASGAYGIGNGEELFNCNLGGTAGTITGIPGDANWICGTPRAPHSDEIARDSILDAELWALLQGDLNTPIARVEMGPLRNGFLDHFGLHREAFSGSLIMEYELGNGMGLSSITAMHSNDQMRLGDFDYRPTCFDQATGEDLPGGCGASASGRVLEDFSQEFRLSSSPDSNLRWMIGLSYSDIEELLGLGGARSGSSGLISTTLNVRGSEVNTSKTTGLFGSTSYKFTDQIELSVEGRYQEDEIISSRRYNTNGQEPLKGTFTSFTPRIILDFKPREDMTIYGSYAEGNHPGVFNSSLLGLEESNPADFACVDAAIFSGVEVPEETLTNFEVGFKSLLWEGRALVTVAAYIGEWRDQHNRGEVSCLQPDGTFQGYQSTGLGGETDMQGFELEFTVAVSEMLTIEGTYGVNETEILKRDSNDAGILLGERELAGLGNQFSRYPKSSGSLSASLGGELAGGNEWFARLDYIFKDGKWASDANVTKTPAEKKVNLRAGLLIGDSTRIEAYVTNLTDDDTFTGLQTFGDNLIPGDACTPNGYEACGNRRMLTWGLPPKRTVGVRVTHRFDFNN